MTKKPVGWGDWLLLGTAAALAAVVSAVVVSRRGPPAAARLPVALPPAHAVILQQEALPQRFIRSFELASGFFPDGLQGRYLAAGGVVELALAPQGLSIVTKEAGREDRTVTVPWQAKLGDQILVVRDGERLAVCLNSVAVAQAEVMPDVWQKEDWSGNGTPLDKVQFQKTAAVFFADDFMHEESDLGDWKPVRGAWKVNTLANPVRSANAFSFVGGADAAVPGKNGLVLAGQWFWTNYSFSSTVQPLDAKGIGWVFCYQDDDNTYKLTWQDRLVLTRRVAGVEQELAAAPIFILPRQWSRVEMENLLGVISVRIDGITVLTVVDPAPVFGGKVGLMVNGAEGAVFDDILVQGVNRFEWKFTNAISSPCIRQQALPAAADNSARRETALAGMQALNSQLEVKIANMGNLKGEIELQSRRQPNGDALSFRIRQAEGKALGEIVRRGSGKTEILGSFPLPAPVPETRLSLHLLNDEAWACVDGTMVGFVKGASALGRGESRVVVPEKDAANGTSLVSLSVQPQEQMIQVANRVQTFEREDESGASGSGMTAWSSAAGEWTGEPRWGYAGFFAHRSDFWQDFVITANLGKLSAGTLAAPFGLAAFDPRQDRKEAVIRVVATPKPDGKILLTLCSGDEIRRQQELLAMPKSLALARLRGRLLVKVDDSTVWNEPLPESLRSLCSLARFGADSVLKWAAAVTVCADGQRTYAFKEAPSDWQAVSGNWAITNRWQCDPRWSFFSGVNQDGPACLWNKASHGENFSLEFFIGPKMDNFRGGVGYDYLNYVADFNATICADGKDLSSGYSFMYGGFADTGSFLMREDKELAKNLAAAAIIPRNPEVHHRWFHIKIRKDGSTLTMWVDGTQICQAKDAQPLTGNRFAIWTWKNGVMVAQVRVSSDKPLETSSGIFDLPKINTKTPYGK
jgi:hypothetical protein